MIGPSYTSKATASLKRTSEGNPEGLLNTPVLHVSVLVSAGNRDDRMFAWQLSIGRAYRCQEAAYDAMASYIVSQAEVVEGSVRRVLMDRLDFRAGVVNDSPIHGASPAWLEDLLSVQVTRSDPGRQSRYQGQWRNGTIHSIWDRSGYVHRWSREALGGTGDNRFPVSTERKRV